MELQSGGKRPLVVSAGWAACILGLSMCCCIVDAQDHPLAIQSGTPEGFVKLSWPSQNMRPYQLERSKDLLVWEDVSSWVLGNGGPQSVSVETAEPRCFFRLREGAIRNGFSDYTLPANDDGSSTEVPFGFPIRIFPSLQNPGPWTGGYVNNNGNITIGVAVANYTPQPLQTSAEKLYGVIALFAPFWGDVDTQSANYPDARSKVVSYGPGTINGNPAFGANWVDVGYYFSSQDKLNSFQMILISRVADTGVTGDFDVEFNYNQIQWETGSHISSGGINGYGGFPARCGITNGIDRTVELTYSGQTLLQLDVRPETGLPQLTTGLIYRSRNSPVPGRFIFQVRNGDVLGALEVSAGPNISLPAGVTTARLNGIATDPSHGQLQFHWSVLDGPADIEFSAPHALTTDVTVPEGENATIQLTVTSLTDPNIGAADIMQITR